VRNPASADPPVILFTDPVFHHKVYLDQIVPSAIHNVWTAVAFAILMVFFAKGICEYLASYLVNYVGFSAVTDLRNVVFSKVLKQGGQFFESHSTGKLMSSIMNDIEKIQVASSHILADFLRQTFVPIGLRLAVPPRNWPPPVFGLPVLHFVTVPPRRMGKRIRRPPRRAQDNAAELNQILQETLTGHQMVKAFGTEAFEGRRF